MITKNITGECNNCDSYFSVEYKVEMVSQEIPEHCPFCGELIEEISEEFVENDEIEEEDWD